MMKNDPPHPAEYEDNSVMERRKALQTMLGLIIMGVGFTGLAKQALAKEDANGLAKAARNAGFQPPSIPKFLATQSMSINPLKQMEITNDSHVSLRERMVS